MNELSIRAVVSGLLFGIWPVMMSQGGLKGTLSGMALAIGALLILAPFAVGDARSMTGSVSWPLVIGAAAIGGIALLVFSTMLSKAPQQNLGSLCVIMVVCQIAVPASYQLFKGEVTLSRVAGIAAALLAAFLLR